MIKRLRQSWSLSTAVVAGVLLVSIVATAPARAGVIYSEDFSSGTLDTTTVPGWTLTGSTNSVLVLDSQIYRTNASGVNDTGTGNFLSFSAGNSPDNGIARSPAIAVTSGDTYTVSFLYGSFSISPNLTQSMEVLANGVPVGAVPTGASTNDLAAIFSPYSFSFTATSPALALSFEDTSTNTIGVDGFLDNVAVATNATPLPSTWTMMIAGFVGLGFLGYRGTKKASAGVLAT